MFNTRGYLSVQLSGSHKGGSREALLKLSKVETMMVRHIASAISVILLSSVAAFSNPVGSYSDSCSSCYVSADGWLNCSCRSIAGQWFETEINVNGCPGESFSNIDGHLRCDSADAGVAPAKTNQLSQDLPKCRSGTDPHECVSLEQRGTFGHWHNYRLVNACNARFKITVFSCMANWAGGCKEEEERVGPCETTGSSSEGKQSWDQDAQAHW